MSQLKEVAPMGLDVVRVGCQREVIELESGLAELIGLAVELKQQLLSVYPLKEERRGDKCRLVTYYR